MASSVPRLRQGLFVVLLGMTQSVSGAVVGGGGGGGGGGFQPPPSTGTAASTPVAPDGSVSYSFDQSGTLFQQDFDDFYGGIASNNVEYSYSGILTGTGPSAGDAFTSDVFSANSNASHTFVGFLGVGPNGEHSDAVFAPTIVAYIYDPNNPSQQIGYVTADYSYTTGEDTTFTAVSTSSLYGFDEQFNANDNGNAPGPAGPEVPEPASLTLFGLGIGLFGFSGWRRCREPSARR